MLMSNMATRSLLPETQLDIVEPSFMFIELKIFDLTVDWLSISSSGSTCMLQALANSALLMFSHVTALSSSETSILRLVSILAQRCLSDSLTSSNFI